MRPAPDDYVDAIPFQPSDHFGAAEAGVEISAP
jgi:hypothetical protein